MGARSRMERRQSRLPLHWLLVCAATASAALDAWQYEASLELCVTKWANQTEQGCTTSSTGQQAVTRCILEAEAPSGVPNGTAPLRMIAPDVAFAWQLVNASRVFTRGAGLPDVNWTLPSTARVGPVMMGDIGGAKLNHAYVLPSNAIGDVVWTSNVAHDISEMVAYDSILDWSGLLPLYREVLAVYGGSVLAIPVLGQMMVMYWRRDLLAEAGLTPPRTWRELIEHGHRFNGTDLNGDGQPDYGICAWRTSCESLSNPLVAILASIAQSKGRQAGLWFEPETMKSVLDTVAWEAAVRLARNLTTVAAPVSAEIPTFNSPCFSQPLFRKGRCAFALAFAGQFKTDSSPGNPETVIRGKIGSSILPGSEVVLDWKRDVLVPCDPEVCPHATSYSVGASSNSSALAASRRLVAQEGRRLQGLSSTQQSKTVWVNNAPYAGSGGQSVFINRYKTGPQRLATFNTLVQTLRGVGWSLATSPGSEFGPTRTEHLDPTMLSNWNSNGYHPDDLAHFLQASRESLASGNIALDYRAAGGHKVIKDFLNAAAALVTNIEVPLDQVMPASRAMFAARYNRSTVLTMQASYKASIKFIEAKPPSDVSRSGTSRQSVIITAVVVAVAGALVLAAMAACVVWQVLRARKLPQRFGRIVAPGVGPATTIVISDIQDSTRLWEALPEDVMNETLLLHDQCIRRCAAACAGYEFATEGDSFLLAFHSPRDALLFCVAAHDELTMLSWPTLLLQDEICRPVWVACAKLPRAALNSSHARAPGQQPECMSGAVPFVMPQTVDDGTPVCPAALAAALPRVPVAARRPRALVQLLSSKQRGGLSLRGTLQGLSGPGGIAGDRSVASKSGVTRFVLNAAAESAAIAGQGVSEYSTTDDESSGQMEVTGFNTACSPNSAKAHSSTVRELHNAMFTFSDSCRSSNARVSQPYSRIASLHAQGTATGCSTPQQPGSPLTGTDPGVFGVAEQAPTTLDQRADAGEELMPAHLMRTDIMTRQQVLRSGSGLGGDIPPSTGVDMISAAAEEDQDPRGDMGQAGSGRHQRGRIATGASQTGIHNERSRLLMRGLRVRFGVHSGVYNPADVHSNTASTRTRYSGLPIIKTRAVVGACPGGMVLISGATHALLTKKAANASQPYVVLQGKRSLSASCILATASAGKLSVASSFMGASTAAIPVQFWYAGVHRLDEHLAQPVELYMAGTTMQSPRWALLAQPGPAVRDKTVAEGVAAAPVGELVLASITVTGGGVIAAWNVGIWKGAATLLWKGAAKLCSSNGGFLATTRAGAGLVPAHGAIDVDGTGTSTGAGTSILLTAVFPTASAGVRWSAEVLAYGLLADWPSSLLLHELAEETALLDAGTVRRATLESGMEPSVRGCTSPAAASSRSHAMVAAPEQVHSPPTGSRHCSLSHHSRKPTNRNNGMASEQSAPSSHQRVRLSSHFTANEGRPGPGTSHLQARTAPAAPPFVVALGELLPPAPVHSRGSLATAFPAARVAETTSVSNGEPRQQVLSVCTTAIPQSVEQEMSSRAVHAIQVRRGIATPSIARTSTTIPALALTAKPTTVATGAVVATGGMPGAGVNNSISTTAGITVHNVGFLSASSRGSMVSSSLHGTLLPVPIPIRTTLQLPGHDAHLNTLQALPSGSSTYATMGAQDPADAVCIDSSQVDKGDADGAGKTADKGGSLIVSPPASATAAAASVIAAAADGTNATLVSFHCDVESWRGPSSPSCHNGSLAGNAVRPTKVVVSDDGASSGLPQQLTVAEAMRLLTARHQMHSEEGMEPASQKLRTAVTEDEDNTGSTGPLLPSGLLDRLVARGLRLRAGVDVGDAHVEINGISGDARYIGPVAHKAVLLARFAPVSHVLVSPAVMRAMGETGSTAVLAAIHPAMATRVKVHVPKKVAKA